ncbi:hypothetical protein BPT24_277 [Tenacibaculum phage pT24]|uniref:Uncharacterized protein n=1 Tax=Tenacibaculum phage pT24 TaxID=1880590 RepID=A0A1B4XX58_9CAUD|nr:hypothetical protein HYP10_gp251 [Tenacibaculum phage pT24]BAV39394.1 hypothetical protein BPT24_277 [Tenacibaculum phage pT24]
MQGNVEIKDYEYDKHLILVGLQMVGLRVDYQTADLIDEVITKVKSGELKDMEQAIELKVRHEEKYKKYFESKE